MNVTQNGLSLKMECHSKLSVSHNKRNFTHIGMSQKWNVTKNGMQLKLEYHSKWNVTQNRMSPKMECHPNGNFPQMEFY